MISRHREARGIMRVCVGSNSYVLMHFVSHVRERLLLRIWKGLKCLRRSSICGRRFHGGDRRLFGYSGIVHRWKELSFHLYHEHFQDINGFVEYLAISFFQFILLLLNRA